MIKILFGLIGKSQALIADGIHSVSDLTTDIIGIIGIKTSRKPEDKNHPYGHGRIEYITTSIIAVVIFLLGVSLIIGVFNAPTVIPENIVVFVVLFTIIAKYLLSSFLIRKGNKYKSNILSASGKESRADVLSSLVVLITFILSRFSNDIEILKYSDKIGGIIVGLIIIKIAISIFFENIGNVLGQVETSDKTLKEIKKIIFSIKEVKTLDELNILKFGHYYQIILSISVIGEISIIEGHKVADKVEKLLIEKREEVKYVTVHVNPYIKE